MPVQIPDRRATVTGLQAYARASMPELDSSITKRRGFIGGLLVSLGSALHDWYVALKRYGDREPFPQTATGNFLTQGWWADITGLERNPASAARGRLAVTGTAGTILPALMDVSFGGIRYRSDNSATIGSITLALTSLTRDGSTAIAETNAAHDLATGMTVTISGATQADYNGSFVITATAPNEFTYDLGAAVPATPATGAPKVTATFAAVTVTATTTGATTNVTAGAIMTISSPPSGADTLARVTFGGIADGSDIEDMEAYRERILEALGTDFGMFSEAEIKIVAKQVPGVTRVFVRPATLNATNGVAEGQVVIAFLRDNDANPLPSSLEVQAVKDHLLATIVPAHTAAEDVMVISPTGVTVPFVFTAISPDTTSMRLATRARLQQFFAEEVAFGETLTEDSYRCAILSTFDTERAVALRSFTLTAPVGDVAIAWNELPRLGSITWP